MKTIPVKETKIQLKKRIFSMIPALLFMVFIYMNSAKTAVESSAVSDPISEFFLGAYESVFGDFSDEVRPDRLNLFSHIIRKSAHMAEYALLGILVSIHLYVIKFNRKKLCITSIAFCTFYAATDEFHQYFVPGRSCQLSDVCIDATGAVIGTLLFLLIFYILNKKAVLKY